MDIVVSKKSLLHGAIIDNNQRVVYIYEMYNAQFTLLFRYKVSYTGNTPTL